MHCVSVNHSPVCPAQDMSSQQAVVESVASSLKKAGLFEMVLTSSVW